MIIPAIRNYLLVALLVATPAISRAGDDSECPAHTGQWLDPSNGERLHTVPLFERLAGARIVLLGESHTSASDHRWQLYTLAALHSRHPNLVVGFEMLPRAAQPVLDEWSAGKLDEQQFLKRSRWRDVWGYDPDYYLPLLQLVRTHRLPAVALNVDRQLVSRVGEVGWQAVPKNQRAGLSDPAPASRAYRESLAELYAYKQSHGVGTEHAQPAKAAKFDEILASDEFAHFVDAQLTWDRAMAEALAAAARRDPSALVVGIAGRGHIEHGYGIPHQLADLGIGAVEALLPVDAGSECDAMEANFAAAVFVVDPSGDVPPKPRARLGVLIETAEGGVRVLEVVDGSVAAAAGMRAGDIIKAAAGFTTTTASELIEIVGRQAPGTWLPLEISRDGEYLRPTARFPQHFE